MRFVDLAQPDNIKGFPCVAVPVTSTTMVEAGSGDESANENWENPLHRFRLPKVINDMATFNALKKHWYNTRGPARLWPFRDPLDFASADLECANVVPTITMLDQQIGIGDGVTTQFQLVKAYVAGAESVLRTIQLPIVSSVLVSVNGVAAAAAPGPGPYAVAVQRAGGLLTITPAVPAALIIRAGFLFDVPVRYENDTTLEGIVESWQVNGNADLSLLERKLC